MADWFGLVSCGARREWDGALVDVWEAQWPARVVPGDRVRTGGVTFEVAGIEGPVMVLRASTGETRAMTVLQALWDAAQFLPGTAQAADPDAGRTSEEGAWALARFWERHVVEVITGRPPAGAGEPNPAYDPDATSLTEREIVKARELSEAGPKTVSARTVQRRRLRYEAKGLEGLVDGRAKRVPPNGARVDVEVRRALFELVAGALLRDEEVSADRLRRDLVARFERRDPSLVEAVPARSSIRRIVERARQVPGPLKEESFGLGVRRSREPGERVWLETFTVEVEPRGADVARIAVTMAVDEATQAVLAALAHPPDAPVDGRAVVLRVATPRALLPDASEGLGDEDLTRVCVRPRSLVAESGPLIRSATLRQACRKLGVDVASRSVDPGWRFSLGQAAGQVEGEVRAAVHAGTWVRPGDDAADPGTVYRAAQRFLDQAFPGAAEARYFPQGLRPDARGHLDLPFEPGRVLALLPSQWRQIASGGVHVHGRRYTGAALEFTDQPHADRIRIHLDPADPSRLYAAGSGGWYALPETRTPEPRRRENAPGGAVEATARGTAAVGRRPILFPRPYNRWPDPDEQTQPGPDGDVPQAARLAHHAALTLRQAPLVAEVVARGRTLLLKNTVVPHPYAPRQILLVTGPPGAGKATALWELARDVIAYDRELRPNLTARRPVIHTRVRPGSNGRQYLADLATRLRLDADRKPLWQLYDVVREHLLNEGTRLIVVDEADVAVREDGDTLEVLRLLADQLPALFALTAVDLDPAVSWPRAIGRVDRIHARPVPAGQPWDALVADLDGRLRLLRHRPGSLLALADQLHAHTVGLVGRLVTLVASAAIEAIHDGSEDAVPKVRQTLAGTRP